MESVRAMVLAAVWLWVSCALVMGQEAEDTFGCEANPTGDPIGGGEGYRDIKTTGDFIAKSKDDLLAALKEAKAGQTIFIPDGVEIDLTGERNIAIPGGVTLAGTRGLDGSAGARIFTSLREGHTLFRTAGEKSRLTGLRFEGSFAGTEKVAYHASFLSISHYGCEVDNCEIYNFNVSGIGVGGAAINVRIHHNYIHHCQRSGYGYGVCVGEGAVHIIGNKFDHCRHHVAAGGGPGCSYEVAWCLIMPNCTSYCLDVHGGSARGDNTDIAGDWIHIHHNTFQGEQLEVLIGGTPSQGGEIHHNWFFHPPQEAVRSLSNTRVYSNIYGPEKKPQEKRIELVDGKPVEY